MRADDKSFILRVIESKILFRIPVYQRNYDWPEAQCRRLLDDIEDIFNTGKQHFLGSMVLSQEPSFPGFEKYTVIDGQQRLTTMCLLIKALHDVVSERGDVEEAASIDTDYIHNKCKEEEFKVKLKPINSDGEQFTKLLNNQYDQMDKTSHMWLNYSTCKQRIEKWFDQGKTVDEIRTAFYRLQVIMMILESDDDPQVIFENINSTGLELTYSDLIRNFLLMKADDQEMLYKDYWLVIENSLKDGNDYDNLNDFFMQYIVCKTGKKVNINDLYYVFVDFYKANGYTQQAMLAELKRYSDIYTGFLRGNNQWGDEICSNLSGLCQLNQTTCYPFLMRVFNDWLNDGVIKDRAVVEKTTKLILIYLLRRMVCGVSTSSLRGLFASLYNRIFGKVPANKEKYYEAINNFLFLLDSKDAMPTEEKFTEELKIKEIYKTPALCKFLLKYIENSGKEKIDGLITIEHIMPQTLSVGWEHIDTVKHGEYVHTLGNLTLTGYNSELSNMSFKSKKEYLFGDPDGEIKAKAVTLNSDVQNVEEWDIKQITERADRLTKIVAKGFKIDRIQDDSIEYELTREISAIQSKEATGTKPLGFKFDGKKYRQVSYSGILSDMVKLLYQKHPDVLQDMVEDDDFGWIVCAPDKARGKGIADCKIADGMFIDIHDSAAAQLNKINRLLDKCGEPQSMFSCIIPAEENVAEEEDTYDEDEND